MKEKMLEWTGERYLPFVDPEISGAEIHYEHLHRYAFAAQFVKGKKVLDFASGEGYGSYMLSKEAELVIGVEIDEKTVKHASSTYIRDNLEFMLGSILKVPIEGEKMFDAIICFEAMEHVEEHEELMNEVKRLLKDDGVFIVSSPNKKVYTDDPDYHNPFHQKELYFDEFKNLLNNYFTNTIFFGQRVYTASNLWCLTSKEAPNDYSEFVIKKGDDEFYFSDGKNPLYFIAVASNADLNERYNMRSYLVDASNILIGDYKRQINEFNVVVQERDEHIRNLDAHITNISGQLTEKDKQITELNATVHGKDAHIQNLDVQIDDISSQLKEKEQLLDTLNVAVQGKDAHIQNLGVQIDDISSQLKEKEQLLDTLNVAVQGKDELIKVLELQIDSVSGQLKEKEQLLDTLNVAVQGKDELIKDLELQIDSVSGQLKEKEQLLDTLNVAVQGKDELIKDLELQIDSVSGQLKEKEQLLDTLNVAVQGKDAHIQNLGVQIDDISSQLNDKKERLREIDTENLTILSELNSMKSSATWRTVMKWHSLVENLMPPMTRRRRWYDLRIIGLRTITNEGGNSFWWKYKQYRASKRVVQSSLKSTKIESPKLDLFSEKKSVDLIEKIVSVVIPTKNAGPDFDFTLEKIRNQKGIKEIEIIIVDSGSTDETVKLAEKYGAKVYSIKPEEFNHGLTRNYGAEKATGDYILFMVQDAIPIGNYWLYKMAEVLENNPQIAAATCRQVPRSNADLFACFSIWNHHEVLDFYEDRIAEFAGDFDKLPPIEKRKLCGLDDVSTLVRKDAFDKFEFKEIQYAEDIDLGLRLLRGGYKLAFLHSVGVVHSHNRDTSYFIRRYYVDNKMILQRIFNYTEYYPESNFDEFLYSILAMYSALNLSMVSIKELLQHTSDDNRYPIAITKLEGLMQENLKVSDIKFNGDKFLNVFFRKINEIVKEKRTNDNLMNFVLSHYQNQLNDLKEFIVIYNPTEEDFIATLYKLFSIVVASVLASKLPEYKDNRAYLIESLLEGGA